MTTRGEFRATYTDPVTGDVKPAWQFVVENTDPRYVAFELDVLWATDGGADPVALLNRYGSRIKMLHIKDGISVADPANATPVRWVRGRWTSARSWRPPGVTSTTTSTSRTRRSGDPAFDPFVSARAGFTYLDCFRY